MVPDEIPGLNPVGNPDRNSGGDPGGNSGRTPGGNPEHGNFAKVTINTKAKSEVNKRNVALIHDNFWKLNNKYVSYQHMVCD